MSLQLFSQNLVVGFGWGLTNFQNSIVESTGFNQLSYNADSEYRYSFSLKYKIPTKNLRFKGGYNYSSIIGSGVVSHTSENTNSTPLNVKTENDLKTLILGLEYVVKDSLFTPYFGMDLLVAVFDDVRVRHRDKYDETVTEIFPSKTKIGLGLNIGLGYTVVPGMELDINLLFGSLNFLGKKDYENQITSIDLTVSLLFVL